MVLIEFKIRFFVYSVFYFLILFQSCMISLKSVYSNGVSFFRENVPVSLMNQKISLVAAAIFGCVAAFL